MQVLDPSALDPTGASDAFATIEEAIGAIARGEMVIVLDDPGRENEGDFVMAADAVTPEAINFMVTHGRGLVCMPMAPEQLDLLGIAQMVPHDPSGTAFAISIDMAEPANTGISAHDRARTIAHAISPDARPTDFITPGHIFPLRARVGGVLAREGHTEAAVDLARLAGRSPAGVICEILNEDGTMARRDDLFEVARAHGLLVITIEDLKAYLCDIEAVVERGGEAALPTRFGPFTARAYLGREGEEHLALIYGDPTSTRAPLVRLHSECLTGDALGSMRCDCGEQLREAMRLIALEGAGVIVYLRGHEGRGIGLIQKLRAYALQDDGADTVEANLRLGLPVDARTYTAGAQILRDLGLRSVRLLTNNPQKRAGIEAAGIIVAERLALRIEPTTHNLRYLEAKRDRLGHDVALEMA